MAAGSDPSSDPRRRGMPVSMTREPSRPQGCFKGRIYVINTPLPAAEWPETVAYEWAATVKALFLQRSC